MNLNIQNAKQVILDNVSTIRTEKYKVQTHATAVTLGLRNAVLIFAVIHQVLLNHLAFCKFFNNSVECNTMFYGKLFVVLIHRSEKIKHLARRQQ